MKARMAREGVELQVSPSDELGKLTAQQYAKMDEGDTRGRYQSEKAKCSASGRAVCERFGAC